MINPVLRTSTGRLLRYCSVEVQPEGKYMTDPHGQVWMPTRSGSVQAKVWAETPAGRVVNGEKFNMAYTQDVTLTSSGSVTVTDENNAFTLSQIMMEHLEDFRNRFPTWRTTSFGEDNGVRIEASWPDKFGQPILKLLPFVEPASSTGYPLIHYPATGNYQFPDPGVIKHEYGHALHFSLVPRNVRDAFAKNYLDWLTANLSDPYHQFDKVTTEHVAWIEAWGSFFANEGSLGVPFQGDATKIEGAVCNLVLRRLPQLIDPSNPSSIQETFITSKARTLKEYATWVSKWNPTVYQVLKTTATNEFHITLP